VLFQSLIEDIIRGVSGPLGVRARRAYYRRRLRSCGARLVIEPGVHLLGPQWISLGDDVWIDRQAIMIAGPPALGSQVSHRQSPGALAEPGEIRIGHRAHIGVGSVMQGHGGVRIGDAFTLSPHAKIYSFSNDQKKCRAGTHPAAAQEIYYVMTPVFIGDNVWVGINAAVIGHSIGSDTFVKPGSVVSSSIPPNSVVEGAPARITGARFDGEVEAPIRFRKPVASEPGVGL
jgi:acetyltransferase-like isoleucine patch superfamily enzyme